jgi:hypothetical protein
MRIEVDSKLKLIEGVSLYVDHFGARKIYATYYKPEDEAKRLADEQAVIEAGFVKHEGNWMARSDAEFIKRCEEEMQEHKRIIIEG